MKLREAVGAHQGLGSWVGQLLSALMMLVALIWVVAAFGIMQPNGYAGLVSFIGANVVRVPATLGILALVWHAWLGVKSVLMDYVPWAGVRIYKYVGTICFLLLCLVWILGVFWSV